MNITEIIIAVVVLCVTSIIVGIVLSLAEKAFHVDINELEQGIRELLPGNNCGGCGYAGCDALAKAIAEGNAGASACPVGGEETAKSIAALTGGKVGEAKRNVAFVKCKADCEKKKVDFNYYGKNACSYASEIQGGQLDCKYGCLGLGSCTEVCDTGAIRIEDGRAVVDESLCTACGRCVAVCPKHIIELVPCDSKYRVQCSSLAKGKDVRAACEDGCIGCGICVRNCPSQAVLLENNLAAIAYEKCISCGVCAQKCPRKIIV